MRGHTHTHTHTHKHTVTQHNWYQLLLFIRPQAVQLRRHGNGATLREQRSQGQQGECVCVSVCVCVCVCPGSEKESVCVGDSL